MPISLQDAYLPPTDLFLQAYWNHEFTRSPDHCHPHASHYTDNAFFIILYFSH
jgi:hypothetical protein